MRGHEVGFSRSWDVEFSRDPSGDWARRTLTRMNLWPGSQVATGSPWAADEKLHLSSPAPKDFSLIPLSYHIRSARVSYYVYQPIVSNEVDANDYVLNDKMVDDRCNYHRICIDQCSILNFITEYERNIIRRLLHLAMTLFQCVLGLLWNSKQGCSFHSHSPCVFCPFPPPDSSLLKGFYRRNCQKSDDLLYYSSACFLVQFYLSHDRFKVARSVQKKFNGWNHTQREPWAVVLFK